MGRLWVKQIKSGIGRPEKHKRVLKGLGLKRLNHRVILKDSPEVRGMIQKVVHLVEWGEAE